MPDSFFIYLALCASAFAAGVVNSLAGGGTLLTFPVLVATLGDTKLANITSTVALVPGSIAGAWGFRRELGENGHWLRVLVPPSIAGGLVGSLLLTRLPERYFTALVPWLLLLASLLFMVQPRLTKFIHPDEQPATPGAGLRTFVIVFQFFIAVYGGYFGAGIGILMLSALGLLGIGDVHRLNAIKTTLASWINGMSVLVFVFDGAVVWSYALAMAGSAILGGYAGAHFGRRLPRGVVRWFVIVVGLSLSFYYFTKQFFAS